MTLIKILYDDLKKNTLDYIIGIIFFILFFYLLINSCPKINHKITLTYDGIKNSLDTGDMVFFSSTDTIGKAIRYVLNSKYSHVGIIIKSNSGKIYILECDLTNLYDYLTKKNNKYGAHLLSFEEKMKSYAGNKFGVRKLIKKNEINKKLLEKILYFSIIIKFEDNSFKWFLAHLKIESLSKLLNNDDKMFCTQYVAEIYKKLGIFKNNTKSHLITPGDLARDNFELNKNYKFDKMTYFINK